MKPRWKRWLSVLGGVWLLEQFSSWLGTQPFAIWLAGVGVSPEELWQPGGLLLLELARLERGPILGWLRGSLPLLGLALLLGVWGRALLLRAALESEPLPWDASRTLRLAGRLLVHHLICWVLGGLLLLGAFFGMSVLENAWGTAALERRLPGVLLAFAVAFQGLWLVADAWALSLARQLPLWASFLRACTRPRQARLWLVRGAKSLLSLGAAALGLSAAVGSEAGGSLATLAELSVLGMSFGLVALDFGYYRLFDKLSEKPLPPVDTPASDDVPADPTPSPGA